MDVKKAEAHLRSMAKKEPRETPIPKATMDECLAIISLQDEVLIKAVENSLQCQATSHLYWRGFLSNRTSVTSSAKTIKSLAVNLSATLDNIDQINPFHMIGLHQRYTELEKGTNFTPSSQIELRQKISFLAVAANAIAQKPRSGGNRSDLVLETTVGGHLYLIQRVIEPVRRSKHDKKPRYRHLSLKLQAEIIRSILIAIEPQNSVRYTSGFIDYLVRKVRKNYPGEKLATYSHILMLGGTVRPH